jgi:hypothetical protein
MHYRIWGNITCGTPALRVTAKIDKLKAQANIQSRKGQVNTPQDKHTFAKRTVNLTNITFTEDEMYLLNKGLKYNLHYKPKNWIQTLGLEAEIGIKQLPTNEQNYMWHLVGNSSLK